MRRRCRKGHGRRPAKVNRDRLALTDDRKTHLLEEGRRRKKKREE